jgi:hypothetical protein
MLSTDLSRAWSHPAKPAVLLGHAGSRLALQGMSRGLQHVQRRPRSCPTAPTTWLAEPIIAAATRQTTIPGHSLTALYAPCVTSLLPSRAAKTTDHVWRQPPRSARTPKRLALRTARMAGDWPPGLQTRRCPWLAGRVEWQAVTLWKTLARSRIGQGGRSYTHFLPPIFTLYYCVALIVVFCPHTDHKRTRHPARGLVSGEFPPGSRGGRWAFPSRGVTGSCMIQEAVGG